MSYTLKASEVIEVARSYKNYQEKRILGTRDQMWDFHWAAGNKNYTIWAMLYRDYTGANYQGQAWCAMFGTTIVALTYIKKYGLNNTEASKLTKEFFGNAMPFNCQLFVDAHKNDSRLNHTPKVGSSVIFWTGKKYGHWGLVTGVDKNGKGFTSVEGNTSGGTDKVDPDGGAVVEKWHSLDSMTYFWHPDYEEDSDNTELKTYKISTGVSGLTILVDKLNIRVSPGNDKQKTGNVYKYGDKVKPFEKVFVDHVAWYHTDLGWFSASYVEGWVLEDNSKWWYVHKGYTNTVRNWELIDEKWYYMDDTGYIRTSDWVEWKGKWYFLGPNGDMITNAWIKSVTEEKYYWVDNDGVWNPNNPNCTTNTRPINSIIYYPQ